MPCCYSTARPIPDYGEEEEEEKEEEEITSRRQQEGIGLTYWKARSLSSIGSDEQPAFTGYLHQVLLFSEFIEFIG
jgi:hypothetical protein